MKTINWKEIAIVSGCGAVGGLLAWLIASVSSGLAANWQLGLCTAILGGAVAAGAGVYLLANTDTGNAPRCIFFSVFCGVCWQPIVEAGKNLVNEATVHKAVASAKDMVERSIAQSANGGTQAEINQIVEGTGKIADKLPSTSDQELRQDALQTVGKAFAKIGKFGELKPEEATAALETIGQRASASGSISVKLSAKEALMNLRDKTGDRKTWEMADKAIQSIR